MALKTSGIRGWTKPHDSSHRICTLKGLQFDTFSGIAMGFKWRMIAIDKKFVFTLEKCLKICSFLAY
jgi:hypothetical protein